MLKLENERLETKTERLSIEVECLKMDNHIYLEALILSKHKTYGKSSEKTECDGQQSFFNEAEAEYQKSLKNLFQRQLRVTQEIIRRPKEKN